MILGRILLAIVLLVPTAALAEPEAPPGGELREQMRRYFAARLRAELSLTDEQLRAIAPEFDAMERSRRENARERREAALDLRAALRRGAPDEEIARRLERLDAATFRHEEESRARLSRIDAVLTVRQRAELRFFLAEFRQDLERRVRELREGADRPGPGRRGRRAPLR